MWCKHCGRDQPGYTDEINGYTCCTGCGKVIDQDLFSSEVTFLKTSSGQSRVAGSFVKSVRDSGSSESHERTLAKVLVTSKEMERKDMHTLCREISVTAVRIIASMKRDWIQTGRKPNGLCGAALYISALSCGISCSKSDVVNIVHVCDATLTKRLIEFENTESGSLTIDTFIEKAKEFEADVSRVTANVGLRTQGGSEFVEISGGIQGGSDPPAFQRAERERTLKASTDENNEGQSSQTVGDKPNMPHKVSLEVALVSHTVFLICC
ncbi:Transcription factor IIIB subunit [Nymphaea thermarum]|nr:Transcription factor IIIB subunit [Nymphaea thermarum]